MTEYRDEPRRIPHPSTLPPTNITPITYKTGVPQGHPAGPTDERVRSALTAAALFVAAAGIAILAGAIVIDSSFWGRLLLGLVGVLVLATGGVLVWIRGTFDKERGTGVDLDVEDWQRDR